MRTSSSQNMLSLNRSVHLFQLFADTTRVRLMTLLERRELTVAELTAITGLTQSRVSTHLGKLRAAGMLCDRQAGASTFYRASDATMPAAARKVWCLVASEVKDVVLEDDRERCRSLLKARANGEPWPDSVAGQMERHYSPGRTWESLARALLGLIRLGDVLDVGSGDGTIAQLIAPRATRITCLERSPKLLAAARRRLGRSHAHIRFCLGDMHALPFGDDRFDDVLLLNVLTYSDAPSRALAEAVRVLRPGGVLTLATLKAHDHAEVTAAYGHVNTGFRATTLRRMLRQSGLDIELCQVTSRERRKPCFEVITAFASRKTRDHKARER